MNILVIDIGTTSMRGILYNPEGQSVFKYQSKTTPDYLEDGRVEQDPNSWKCELIKIISNINTRCDSTIYSIDAITITAQRSSLIPVDGTGTPLHKAIMWQCKRTSPICDELSDKKEQIYRLTGLKISPVFTAPKMLWLKRNRIDIYNKAHKLLVISDYVTYIMTGKYVTDYSIASRSLLFNINTLQWDDELLNIFQIEREKLCDLVPQGSICGYTTEEFNSLVGLKQSIPVLNSGGDQQCAAVGLNVIHEGSLAVNTGTGSFIVASSNRLIFDDKMRISCNVSSIPNKWILEASILASGSIYRWFAETFYEKNCEDIFEKINEEAANATVGSNNLILMPHFTGSGSPNWNPLDKGMFYNIGLNTKRKEFARAILEGIACEVSENIDSIENLLDNIDKISVAGGLTKFELYNQIQADMFSKDIISYDNEEATTQGAWIVAAKTLELVDDYDCAFTKIKNTQRISHFKADGNNIETYMVLKKQKKDLYLKLHS